MGCPEPKTREEVLAKLKEINQKLHELNIEIQPNTHTDLVRTKHVLQWVLSIDKEL
jgi:hypothetical protein